ncbi:MAG TPA: hypothetical protein VLM80_11845, partial [Anaerolineales bacterium]|nr:hypothetical protein [Anaerolineales bacterium]
GGRFQSAEEYKSVLKPVTAPVANTVVVTQPPETNAPRTVQMPVSKPVLKPVSKPVSKPVAAPRRNWLIFGVLGIVLLLCIGGSLGVFAWIWNDQQARDLENKEETRISLAVTQTTQNRRTQTVEALETADAYRRETEIAQVAASATAQAQAAVDAAFATSSVLTQVAVTQQVYEGELNLAKKWSGALLDSFDQNSYDWTSGTRTGDRADMTWSIANGVYTWDALAKEGFVWWVYPEMDEYADFYYSGDLNIIQGPPEAEQGLVFRMKKDGEDYSYYLFEISNNQQYSVWYRDPSGWSEIVPWTESASIIEGGMNRLALIAQGSRLVFFINDQYVAEASDDRISSGKLGLCVGLDENGQTGSWQFDNLEIRVP